MSNYNTANTATTTATATLVALIAVYAAARAIVCTLLGGSPLRSKKFAAVDCERIEEGYYYFASITETKYGNRIHVNSDPTASFGESWDTPGSSRDLVNAVRINHTSTYGAGQGFAAFLLTWQMVGLDETRRHHSVVYAPVAWFESDED